MEKKGYSFNGFDGDFPATFALEDNNKTVAKVLWSYSGKSHYGVNFYMQNISDDDYTKLEIETAVYTGETGGLTDIHLNAIGTLYIGETKYEFEGFHPAVDSEGNLISENITIDPSETTIAKVYFDRNVSIISILSTSIFYIYGVEELQKITRDNKEYYYYEIKGRYGETVEIPYINVKSSNGSYYMHVKTYYDMSGLGFDPPKFYPEDSTVYEIQATNYGASGNTYNLYYDFNDEDGPKASKENYFAPTPYHDVDVTLYAQWERK